MSKEKQIEEMAKTICCACAIRENCKLEDVCRSTLQESETLYNAGYRKQSDVAKEIIDEIIDALQSEKDKEEELETNAWDECDTVGVHIHRYAEEKLDTLIIALSLYKNKYTEVKK